MKTHQRTKAFGEPVIHRKTQSAVFYLGRKLKFTVKRCPEGEKWTPELISYRQWYRPSSTSLTIGEHGQVRIVDKEMGHMKVRKEEYALNAEADLTAENSLSSSEGPCLTWERLTEIYKTRIKIQKLEKSRISKSCFFLTYFYFTLLHFTLFYLSLLHLTEFYSSNF